MKNKALEFLKNLPKSKTEQFNKAFQLYKQCPGKNLSLERFYNQAGFSPNNLEAILYDLKKLLGISASQIKNFTSEVKKEEKIEGVKPKSSEEIEIKVTATTAEEVFTSAPDEVKETIKLRDEFPFLKDEACPEEFLIIVGKKFNHYDAYLQAHTKLLASVVQDEEKNDIVVPLTPEEIKALALAAVKNFQINQDIWEELNYYKENKTILGKHPIFIERKLKSSIDALTVEKATKRISNLANYIRRDTKNLENSVKEKNKAKIAKFTQKVKKWEIELGLIKAKFGFSGEK